MGKQGNPQKQKQKLKLTEVQPTPWDENLTTTQNIVPDVQRATEAIYKVFNDLEQKRVEHAQIRKHEEAQFSATQENIQKKYADKISTLDAEHSMLQQKIKKEHTNKISTLISGHSKDQQDIQVQYGNKIAELEAQYQDIHNRYSDEIDEIKCKRDDVISAAKAVHEKALKKSNDISMRLEKLIAEIPRDIKTGYRKKGSYSPIEPKFLYLHNLLNETKEMYSRQISTMQMTTSRANSGWIIILCFIVSVIAGTILGTILGLILGGVVATIVFFILCGIVVHIGEGISAAKVNAAKAEETNIKCQSESVRDKLMDKIEAGKIYINKESSKVSFSYELAKKTAQKNYDTAETDIEKKFAILKANNYDAIKDEIEKDCATAITKATKDYDVAKDDIDRNFSTRQDVVEQERKARMTVLDMDIKELESIDYIYHDICNNAVLQQLEGNLMPIRENLGACESSWGGDFSATEVYPKEILLGKILFPATFPLPVTQKLEARMPNSFVKDKGFIIPFSQSMNSPIQLIIDYNDDGKTKVMEGIQSLIMKLLKFMPLYSFSITYIDPIDQGFNFGSLHKLSGITSFDICKKVYTSREDIQKRLKELESFVAKTSATLAGIDSVYSYNAKGNSPIVHHFLIINNYLDTDLSNDAKNSLDVIINNSKKCGISILFTTSGNTSNLLPKTTKGFNLINVHTGGATVAYEGVSYPFKFDKMPSNNEEFLEKFKKICNEGIKIDNEFKLYFPFLESGIVQFENSTNKMLIPFAVDSRKNIVELELGSPLTAHALLSGTTGSGKSTTLHMLITSIIMKYHPDDVQLWLVDYKRVEFAEYIENTPPHVRLIGLERSKEFTCSLLDMIDTEFQRRMELFKQAGANNIYEYRNNGGKIPRIILIVDEFHQMTQAIQSEPQYCQILENILSEYRVFGLSCVFSDQAISVGLRGLTDKGKMQIRTRIAMANDPQEIRETLALDSSFYDEDLKSKMLRMNVGDVIFKRMYEDEAGEVQISHNKYKTVLVTKQERISVIERVVKKTGMPKEKPLIVDGQSRKQFNRKTIDDFERGNTLAGEIPLYIGTPASLNPCFYFSLRKKIDSNVMVIGANDDLRAAVVYWSIYSFKRQSDCNIYIFADEGDELLNQYRQAFSSLKGVNCLITTNLSEICNVIDDLHGSLKAGNKPTFVVWLGLERIAEELVFLPEKAVASERGNTPTALEKKSNSSAADKLEADLDAMLESAFGTTSISELVQSDSSPKADTVSKPTTHVSLPGEDENAPTDVAYNIAPNIQEIIAKGPRYNIFTLATYSSYKSLRDTKFVKTDNFEHKVAFNMTMDESANYLGRSSHASGLDTITAVYYDGISTRTFRPYLIL